MLTYPTYEQLEQSLKALFSSRLKRVTKDDISIWIDLILRKHYSNETIEKTLDEFLNDGNIELTIPNFFAVARKYVQPLPSKVTVECPYCSGRGVVFGLKFDTNGKWTRSADYALNCVCGNSKHLKIATMEENPISNHKTFCKDGYYLIFKDAADRYGYINKVNANGGYDIR